MGATSADLLKVFSHTHDASHFALLPVVLRDWPLNSGGVMAAARDLGTTVFDKAEFT
jgi:hypothetical protein